MHRTRGKRRTRGQALVEFALVFPIFFLILAGILDFGFLMYSRITLINATREGARAAVTQLDNAQGIPGIVRSTIQSNSTGLVLADLTVTRRASLPAGELRLRLRRQPGPGAR